MITRVSELTPQEDDPKAYLPSPTRIARMCAAIRRRWTERDFKKRSAAEWSERWTAPVVYVRLDRSSYPVE